MTVLHILILIACAAVAATLGVGVYSLYRGGAFARNWSNKLMRLRIALQFTAVLLIVVAAIASGWWKL